MRVKRFTRDLLALLIVVIVLANPAMTAPTAEASTLIPARDLQADFVILKRAYEELHPGLYRYNSKGQMEADLKALAAELNHDLTLQQAYLAFSIFWQR